VFVFRKLDGLEIARSRDGRRFFQGRVPLLAGQPCRLLIFPSKDGEVGGPPTFGVLGRARAWGVVFKKACEAVQCPGEPVV